MSSRERRASLPGVDELFRSTARPAPRRTPEPDQDEATAPDDVREGAEERDDIVTPMRRPVPERSSVPVPEPEPPVQEPPAPAEDVPAPAASGTDVDLLRAAELAGSLVAPRGAGEAPSPAVGAVLAWAASTVAARQVVEVDLRGPGSARWTLSGMPRGGTMTLIGADAGTSLDTVRSELQSDDPGLRVRTIPGDPTVVLERLADGAYDLVIVRASSIADRTARGHAVRLLRAGGILVVIELEGDDTHGRGVEVVRELAEDPRLRGFVVPVAGGVLVASRS